VTIAWQFADTGREYALSLANGELRHRTGAAQGASDAAVRISRTGLDRLIAGRRTAAGADRERRAGDRRRRRLFAELLGLLDPPDPIFAVVTP
jgi:alkyl sulfatase BDS1-like metallo-beta-lactamase superfamily hydrolase